MSRKYFDENISVAYPASQVSYRWHNPTMAVGYEGELQLSQFDIINTKYRQVNFSRDATGANEDNIDDFEIMIAFQTKSFLSCKLSFSYSDTLDTF